MPKEPQDRHCNETQTLAATNTQPHMLAGQHVTMRRLNPTLTHVFTIAFARSHITYTHSHVLTRVRTHIHSLKRALTQHSHAFTLSPGERTRTRADAVTMDPAAGSWPSM